ncbi:MAG: MarR family winged helix-turn-helix transcriptional regulator [Flavobacteriales bacterium]
MKPSETVDYNIKSCWHAIYRMYNNEAAKYGSTTTVGFVLLNIDLDEGTPATKIAPLLGMEARSLTRTLKNLEENGLIKRMADKSDRRLVRIFLTPLGKEKREIARKSVKNFNAEIQKSISKDKLETFFEVINEINKTAENLKSLV